MLQIRPPRPKRRQEAFGNIRFPKADADPGFGPRFNCPKRCFSQRFWAFCFPEENFRSWKSEGEGRRFRPVRAESARSQGTVYGPGPDSGKAEPAAPQPFPRTPVPPFPGAEPAVTSRVTDDGELCRTLNRRASTLWRSLVSCDLRADEIPATGSHRLFARPLSGGAVYGRALRTATGSACAIRRTGRRAKMTAAERRIL